MPISAFDLDHTLLTVNCSYSFGKFLFSQGRLSLPKMLYLVSCYAAHAAGMISVAALHQLNFDVLFKGRAASEYERLVGLFLDEYLQTLIYHPAFKVFSDANESGHHTAILSSSPDFLVRPIAHRFNAAHVSSTKYLVGESGLFCELGPIMSGEEKASVLREIANQLRVSQENIYAYSDSHLDLPFMEAAGHAVAVRPNRQLRKISTSRGWTIL